MNIKEKLKLFKEKMEEYFVQDKKIEWVDIEIVNVNYVDMCIVSDKINDLKDSENFIEEKLNELNEEINQKEKFRLRITNYNTIEQAEFLAIEKPIRRKKQISTFSELIDSNLNYEKQINENENEDEKKNLSKIISFYSYKGGVGRTVALIQTAYLLAEQGKRVLLMDLDIEAPSFYDIFRDSIKKEFGIVDYLYDQLYNTEEEIILSNIISKLNMNLKGEIYFIPAGRISKEYVVKLDKLKEKRIYENQYIQELIQNAEKQFNIDYTFIDSRTGINNWGALSLIDIADEVMLFAYPNKENIEGLKLIKELIDEHKKATIVLSRIDSSKEGAKTAESLFRKLNLEQEYISILYNPAIATASKLPVEKIREPYNVISNFILEEEENIKTSNILKEKKDMIKNVLNMIKNVKKINDNTLNENKINQESNSIVICEQHIFNKFIKYMLYSENINLNQEQYEKIMPYLQNVDETVYRKVSTIEDNDGIIKEQLKEKLKEIDFNEITENKLNRMVWTYIINLIENNNNVETKKNVTSFDKIDGEYITNVLQKISKFNIEEMPKDIYRPWDIILYFTDILEIFEDFLNKETEYAVINSILTIVNKLNIFAIRQKIIVDPENYNKYREIFDQFDTNIITLSWKALDEKSSESVITEIKNYVSIVFDENIEYYTFKNILNPDKEINKLEYEFDKIFMEVNHSKDVMKVVLGIRSIPNVYSKKIFTWIYEQLKERNKLNQEYLIDFLKKSAKIELENIENKKEYSRIISLNSMKEALEQLL